MLQHVQLIDSGIEVLCTLVKGALPDMGKSCRNAQPRAPSVEPAPLAPFALIWFVPSSAAPHLDPLPRPAFPQHCLRDKGHFRRGRKGALGSFHRDRTPQHFPFPAGFGGTAGIRNHQQSLDHAGTLGEQFQWGFCFCTLTFCYGSRQGMCLTKVKP